MVSAGKVEVRPRTTGEILDEAWRLYLLDAPLLLGLSGLFNVPFAIILLILATRTQPTSLAGKCLLPALAAFLLSLTGLGAGACQEAFRRRAEGRPTGWAGCLGAAMKRGLDHTAARVTRLTATFLGALFLVLPGLAIWGGTGAVHPILAAREGRLVEALQLAGHETQRQPGKVLVIALGHLVLGIFAVINLHALALAGLWIAENLAGFNVALAGAWLSLTHNPVYGLVLVLMAWMLLSPYSEAVNYLLHVDARARFEGLDLWYRVQRHFPKGNRTLAGLVLLAISSCLFFSAAIRAAEPVDRVQTARRELTAIRQEVATREPYPGSSHWVRSLNRIVDRLDSGGTTQRGRYRGLRQTLSGFNKHSRDEALAVLQNAEQQLALIEENLELRSQNAAGRKAWSREEIKALLSGDPTDNEEPVDKPSVREESPKARNGPGDDAQGPVRRRGEGILMPSAPGGLGALGWLFLWGILAAVVVAGLVLAFRNWQRRPSVPKTPLAAPLSSAAANALPDPRTVPGLWQQSEDLARHGQFLEAIRNLYLAVLGHLHRAALIRYETTRTNGEYAAQLRSRTSLLEPFQSLTGCFELKWYGERSCLPADYDVCRRLAEAIREKTDRGSDGDDRSERLPSAP